MPPTPATRQLLASILLAFGIAGVATSNAPEPADPSTSRRTRPSDPGQTAFYDSAVVQTIRLEISDASLRRLSTALPKLVLVPATFQWNDQTIHNVGIRYKGNSSSHPTSPHKRGLLIKFSEFQKKQRFLNLRRVALDNGIQFGSLFSERLITDILRDLGLQASRCNYAKVYWNGEYRGIHVNVERIDESFLESHFSDASGPLFKVHEGGPGADLRDLGANPKAYEKAFERQSGDPLSAHHKLARFIQALNQPQPFGSALALEKLIDLDAFLKTTAVMLLAGAFDQYTGWGPHNYYLYQNPADQRWTYLTWDLDVGFAERAFGKLPVLDGWHAAWPAPVPGRPLMERIVAEPALLDRYRRQASAILERFFRPDVLIPKLEALHAQIREDLRLDPFPQRRATNPDDKSYEDIVQSMSVFIRKRYALARAQLDDPGPRPAPWKPSGDGPEQQPAPGPNSADAPSDLRVTFKSASRVELHWKDNAANEQGFIVQKCLATQNSTFQNAIGLPGENLSKAADPDVQRGASYRYRVYAVKPTPQGPKGTGASNVVTVTIPEE